MQAANHLSSSTDTGVEPRFGFKVRSQNGLWLFIYRSCPPSSNSSSFLLHNNFRSHQIATSNCFSINHQRVILQQSSKSFAAQITNSNPIPITIHHLISLLHFSLLTSHFHPISYPPLITSCRQRLDNISSKSTPKEVATTKMDSPSSPMVGHVASRLQYATMLTMLSSGNRPPPSTTSLTRTLPLHALHPSHPLHPTKEPSNNSANPRMVSSPRRVR